MKNKYTIPVADDEPNFGEMLVSVFQSEGYDAYSKTDKMEAYQWAQKELPDLIISDIASPGMDGFRFLGL